MSSVSTDTVIGFAIVGCIGTCTVAAYYLANALMNKTGPTKEGIHMRDYSGRFEIDLLPIFVNGVTAIWYFGEAMEESSGRFGFFNKYRYAGYLATCPIMMYELVSTIGAPYAITMSTLTFLSLICALFADLATVTSERWLWFGLGTICFITIAFLLYKTHQYARKLNSSLCGQLEGMNNELRQLNDMEGAVPARMLRILTPMDDAKPYIDGAFYLMWIIWPIFPIVFILEQVNVLDRNATQIIYSVADLVCKTLHSIFLDNYKNGLRQTVFSYGFLDTQVLNEIDVWDERGIYAQLIILSQDTYGDKIIDYDGKMVRANNGLDFHSLLVANQRNHSLSKEEELLPQTMPMPFTRRNSSNIRMKPREFDDASNHSDKTNNSPNKQTIASKKNVTNEFDEVLKNSSPLKTDNKFGFDTVLEDVSYHTNNTVSLHHNEPMILKKIDNHKPVEFNRGDDENNNNVEFDVENEEKTESTYSISLRKDNCCD